MTLQRLKEQIELMLETVPKYGNYEVVIRQRYDISNENEPFDSNPLEAFSYDSENQEYCLWIKKPQI